RTHPDPNTLPDTQPRPRHTTKPATEGKKITNIVRIDFAVSQPVSENPARARASLDQQLSLANGKFPTAAGLIMEKFSFL
ncbi:hypothetical protein MUP37_05345, partial [Candidatus Bathyarchaeota archaeon]|nr:hypothetical protein [Candidatus Bathyarchaeota archaeon]